MKPSPMFIAFATDLVTSELAKPNPCPTDVVEARLWAAAQYDCYTRKREVVPMVDGGGIAHADAVEYESTIKNAKRDLVEYWDQAMKAVTNG